MRRPGVSGRLLAALLAAALLGGQWAPATGSPGPGSPAAVGPVAREASSVLDTVRHGLLAKAQQPAESPETVTVDRPAPEVPAVPPGPAPDPTTATAAASLGSRSDGRQDDDYRFINRWWTQNHGEACPRISPYDLIGLSQANPPAIAARVPSSP